METDNVTLVMIPKTVWESVVNFQQLLLNEVKELKNRDANALQIRHVTAIKFMEIVGIKRTKFDTLVSENKIKTIKKRRKIYVPVSEIDRYFNDPTIQ
jgi:hypothetical protein